MTSTQMVEMSDKITNSPFQNYTHSDIHKQPACKKRKGLSEGLDKNLQVPDYSWTHDLPAQGHCGLLSLMASKVIYQVK